MTFPEGIKKFDTDEACQAYLSSQHWPDGLDCRRCDGRKYWTIQRSDRTTPLYEYAECHYHASVTGGTIFHRTQVALSM